MNLESIVEILYKTAASEIDYSDAALLCLMWYLLRRSSDLRLLAKANLSAKPDGAISIRFGRVKTNLDEGFRV